MNLNLEHEAETETPFEKEFLLSVAKATLEKIPIRGLQEKTISLGVAAVTEDRIQELNREYREKDTVTDILSFGNDTNIIESKVLPEENEVGLGDLIYSPEFIERAALEDEISVHHEMAYIFSHGVLHLLGYDHSDEMFAIQDEVTEQIVKEYKL
jgi:probable rRNA maturation factor